MANNGEVLPTDFSSPFLAATRSASASYLFRDDGATNTVSRISGSPTVTNWCVFARSTTPTYTAHSDATLAFYSIGTSLDLTLLDSHITNYVTAIGASI
jgi:hypothetical protein